MDDDKTNHTLWKRLKAARLESGLSQKQLGIEIGLDASVASARMNQYEVGAHSPKYETAQRIASSLGIPTSYLYEDDATIAEVIIGLGKLNKKERKRVTELIIGSSRNSK